MADAIWNNNYLLSNLDAQKLYAQSPLTTGVSGSSAYIGIEPSARYNETVLFENTSGVQLVNGIDLSESRLNFDKLEIYYKNNTNAATEVGLFYWPQYGHNTGDRFRWNLDTPFQDLSTTAGGFMLRWDVLGSASETHIQSQHAYWLGVVGMTGQNAPTINGGENTSIPVVYKIVGINRKEV